MICQLAPRFKFVECNGASFYVPTELDFHCPDIPSCLPPTPQLNAWSVIHRRLANAHDWDEATQRNWYQEEWLILLPHCGDCREKWKQLTKEQPIDWSTRESAYRDLWELHNIVSEKHASNRTIPFDQSLRMWRGPRVALVISDYNKIGGTETFHRTLIPELRHHVDIVGFHVTDRHGGDVGLLKVPYFADLETLIDRSDVVLTWGVSGVREIVRGRKVVTVHHFDLGSELSNRNALQGDVLIAVNADVADSLGGLHIPNAIDPKRAGQCNTKTKTALWLSRFDESKRPMLMIKIARQMPNWHFVMAGTGHYLKDWQTVAPANVEFTGAVDNPSELFSRCSRFVSTSKSEGFGLSCGEAMLSHVPVISTRTGICDITNATIVESDDVEMWVQAIESPNDTTDEAYRFACQFSVERQVQSFADVLLQPIRPSGSARVCVDHG